MAIPVLSNFHLNDDVYIRLGDATNGDLQIYHDGSDSYIREYGAVGDLKITAESNAVEINKLSGDGTGNHMGRFVVGGAVELYHNGSKKFETTSTGATVTGTLKINGSAASLNDLNDILVENNSIYIGNDPSSTTSTAQSNIAIGTTALDAITTGDNNVAIGYQALSNEDAGGDSVAIGMGALFNQNTSATSSANIAIGHIAGHDITTGTGNIIMGYDAGSEFDTGPYNVVIGYGAMNGATGASGRNVFIGVGAGEGSDGGVRSYNVGVGKSALNHLTTGDYNVALGSDAGEAITTGDKNIIIGYDAETSAVGTDNEIVIGSEAVGHGANIIVLGNATHTAIHPGDDNGVDLGSASYSFKDAHIQGVVNAGQINFQKTGFTTITGSSNTFNINFATQTNNYQFTLDNAACTIAFANLTNVVGKSGNIIITNPSSVGSLSVGNLPSEAYSPGGATINWDTNASSVSILSYFILASDKVLINYVGNFKSYGT